MLAYIYYIFYKFILITPSKKEMPEHLASTTLSLVLSINILTLVFYFQKKNVYLASVFLKNKQYYILIFIILLIVNYFSFIRGERYLQIKEKYDNERTEIKTLKLIFVLLYLVITIVMLFYFMNYEG